ncbi:MAG TPA: POTRA domain-containing protein, partial [Kofleriaceae bacterium]
MKAALITTVLVASFATASAQAPIAPITPVKPEQEGDAVTEVTVTPTKVDSAACLPLDLTPGALLEPGGKKNELATPIPWSEFDIDGPLVDRKEVVHALLEPTMQQLRTSLSTATLPQVAELTARFGYQLVGHITQDIPSGTKLVLHLAPLPLVRHVEVSISQSLTDKLLEDDVQRRMSTRAGSYLPWEPVRRQCAMLEERRRIAEFLHDEGYFDAEVDAVTALERSSATVHVKVDLKSTYKLGRVTIACPQGYVRRKGTCVDETTGAPYSLAIPEDEIRRVFEHERCLLLVCVSKARFTREQYQKDLQTVRTKFHTRGFPGVRITSSEVPEVFDRKTHLVNPVLTIDQRRRVDVDFEGHDPDDVSDANLRKQLTFYDAGSADEVETAESARAITTYLQTRGFFDAHVTWTRERIDVEPRPGTKDTGLHFDKIVFHIDTGHTRRVSNVEFVGNKELSTPALTALVATKEAGLGSSFLGTTTSANSAELIADQERIKEAYRRAGYPDARVGTSASPNRAGLDNAAMTASLLAVDDTSALNVRFTIDEGAPTLLTRVVVELEGGRPPDAALCAEFLGALAKELKHPSVALPTDKDKCGVTVADLKFRADDIAATRESLREAMFKTGRARSRVEYVAVPIGPSRVEARYTLKNVGKLRLGKVVIRGNFRTRNRVIYDQLDFDEGDLLTTDRLAAGARRLRNMGLFEAVNLDMPDLDCERDRQCSSEVINAVVRVEERYDHRAEIEFEIGVSQVNGAFGTVRPIFPNILGRGLRFEVAGTYGQKLREVDARFRVPPYLLEQVLPRPIAPTLDFTALYRVQDTPRFGLLTTKGAGVAASKVWQWERTPTRSARAITVGPYYEFKLRSRNLDALRPIGADMDESQVAISTRTGAIGARLDYENRIDRSGQLSPLAPEDGLHAELTVSYAHPSLLSQDTFAKVSASFSKFQPLGKYIVLRADTRYDHGIPLGGAVLLPEVERFFAGGDSTVRGYADDRLETEII